MNILILSAGTRNKIVQYFKKAIGNGGIVVATDMSNLAPAVYEADKFYQVPRMTDDGYIDVIFEICKKENINAVLIEDGLSQKDRLIKLNKIAIHQMSILEEQNPKVLK